MLAVAGPPPAGPGHALEYKYDGMRAIISVAGDVIRIQTRSGGDATTWFPELATLAADLNGKAATFDAEIVALDQARRPDFGLLQRRIATRRPSPALLAAVPVRAFLFDLLYWDSPTIGWPYEQRRGALDALALPAGVPAMVPPAFTDVTGDQMLAAARDAGMEGIVAKRLGSSYRSGRSPAWIKTVLRHSTDVVIAGVVAGRGGHSIGSLIMAMHGGDGRLHYVGTVGAGLTQATATGLRRATVHAPATTPLQGVPPQVAAAAVWLAPVLVGEVTFRGWTSEQRLRHVAWRGWRPDIGPQTVYLPAALDGMLGQPQR
jgi:bifunctional non-homologous end joining protein LigD